MKENHLDLINHLYLHIKERNYKGYDPYDALNSSLINSVKNRWFKILSTQFFVYSPLNFRSIFGIKMGENPKAFGLILRSLIKMKKIGILNKDFENDIHKLLKKIINYSNNDHTGLCWGYNFPWQDVDKYIPFNTPSIVVSSFIGNSILDHYSLSKNQESLSYAKSVTDFVLNDLYRTKDKDGLCFSYSPYDKTITHNANVLGASFLGRVGKLIDDQEMIETARRSFNFTVNKQNSSGSWNYSLKNRNGKSSKFGSQIDYHQGFILDSLMDYLTYIDQSDKKVLSSLEKGMNFYKKQFTDNGRTYFRYPKKWPVDIHAQSQGIITFSRYYKLMGKQGDFAERIKNWALENMLSRKSIFYYHKWPFFKNKIDYIRWSQSWMLLALVEYAESTIAGSGNNG